MLLRTKILIVVWIGLFFSTTAAVAFDTKARSAFVIDQGTGTILLDKNADVPLPPASMSKLMTLYVAFEFIKEGRLSMDETLPVSAHAASYGGSTMFLDTTDRVKVSDLIRGIIVLSGNDACAVIAEALSPDGTEAGFAKLLTMRAQQMGMTQSTFVNSNGWPADGHRMSTRDLALLAKRLIADFPEYYPMFAEQKFEFDGRAPANTRNRNPLLGLGIGADGLKTGHTQEAGYGLVGSAKQGDRRVIFVLSGLNSLQERADESEAIVNWAFRQFTQKSFGSKDQVIQKAQVWNGAAPDVGMALTQDLDILVPVLGADAVSFDVTYTSPIEAPIAKGDRIGTLTVQPNDLPEFRVPLVAAQDVPQGGVFQRLITAARVLLRNWQTTNAGA